MSKTTTSSNSEEAPKIKLALEEKYQEQNKIQSVEEQKRLDETNIGSLMDQLPQPSVWRLLVLPFTPKE